MSDHTLDRIEEILQKLIAYTVFENADNSNGIFPVEVFTKSIAVQKIHQEITKARIDELEKFEPLQQDHSNCPMPETCIGYQNAVSDFDNEKQIRLRELENERIFNKG